MPVEWPWVLTSKGNTGFSQNAPLRSAPLRSAPLRSLEPNPQVRKQTMHRIGSPLGSLCARKSRARKSRARSAALMQDQMVVMQDQINQLQREVHALRAAHDVDLTTTTAIAPKTSVLSTPQCTGSPSDAFEDSDAEHRLIKAAMEAIRDIYGDYLDRRGTARRLHYAPASPAPSYVPPAHSTISAQPMLMLTEVARNAQEAFSQQAARIADVTHTGLKLNTEIALAGMAQNKEMIIKGNATTFHIFSDSLDRQVYLFDQALATRNPPQL